MRLLMKRGTPDTQASVGDSMIQRNQLKSVAMAGVVLLAFCTQACAQFGSSSGSSSSSRTSTSGSSSSRTSTGSSSSRSTSASQMGTGSTGTNTQLNSGDGSLATQVGTGFVGAGQVGGQPAFVGSAQSSQTQQGRNAGQQFQAMNQNNNRRQQQTMNTQRQLPRPQLTIAFDFPAPSSTRMTSGLAASLAGMQSLPLAGGRFPGVTFSVGDEGLVTLAGSVPDERSSQLAEMLVRMEPGVRNVTNNLTVVAPAR